MTDSRPASDTARKLPLVELLLLLLPATARGNVHTNAVDLFIQNRSPSNVGIYWLDPQNNNAVAIQETLFSQTDVHFNSFKGHSFQIRQLPDATGYCGSSNNNSSNNSSNSNSNSNSSNNSKDDQAASAAVADRTCKVAYYTVPDHHHRQYVQVLDNMQLSSGDDERSAAIAASDVSDSSVFFQAEYDTDNDPHSVKVTHCQNEAKRRIRNEDDTRRIAVDLLACLHSKLASTVMHWKDEIDLHRDIRHSIARQLENVTCTDANHPSSPDIQVRPWNNARDNVTRPVHVKLDRPASKIHFVRNFASPQECQAMEDAAKPRLHHATVADGKGGSEKSDARKAMQAGIRPNWAKENQGDLVAQLSRRVYDYANHVLDGLDLQHHGQENLMSIQYFGRGYNDTEPDRYTPHCDGECTGLPHTYGTRMATMVIYCTIPERGGHTNFRNANVHVKPEQGAGVFFSYIDPQTMVMDDHFTEHSGCPTYEGEKKIVTQWIRYGVSARSPWTSYNTLGIKLSEAGD